MFGDCELGDARRTQRLVNVGTLMAGRMGDSLAKSCEGDAAALLGSYRRLRNDGVEPQAIREGGFANVAKHAQAYKVLLAVEGYDQRELHARGRRLTGEHEQSKGSETPGVSRPFGIAARCRGREYRGTDRTEPLV